MGMTVGYRASDDVDDDGMVGSRKAKGVCCGCVNFTIQSPPGGAAASVWLLIA